MPSAADLPTRLQALAHRQALTLTYMSFNYHADRLLAVLAEYERTKFQDAQPALDDQFSDPDDDRIRGTLPDTRTTDTAVAQRLDAARREGTGDQCVDALVAAWRGQI
jgi:hypothetical protein